MYSRYKQFLEIICSIVYAVVYFSGVISISVSLVIIMVVFEFNISLWYLEMKNFLIWIVFIGRQRRTNKKTHNSKSCRNEEKFIDYLKYNEKRQAERWAHKPRSIKLLGDNKHYLKINVIVAKVNIIHIFLHYCCCWFFFKIKVAIKTAQSLTKHIYNRSIFCALQNYLILIY